MTEKLLAEGKRVKFTVSGNSMWPLIIHNRDSVMLVPCDKERLKKERLFFLKLILITMFYIGLLR